MSKSNLIWDDRRKASYHASQAPTGGWHDDRAEDVSKQPQTQASPSVNHVPLTAGSTSTPRTPFPPNHLQQAPLRNAAVGARNCHYNTQPSQDVGQIGRGISQLGISSVQNSHSGARGQPSDRSTAQSGAGRGQVSQGPFQGSTQTPAFSQVQVSHGQHLQGPIHGHSSSHASSQAFPSPSQPAQSPQAVPPPLSQGYSQSQSRFSENQIPPIGYSHGYGSNQGLPQSGSGSSPHMTSGALGKPIASSINQSDTARLQQKPELLVRSPRQEIWLPAADNQQKSDAASGGDTRSTKSARSHRIENQDSSRVPSQALDPSFDPWSQPQNDNYSTSSLITASGPQSHNRAARGVRRDSPCNSRIPRRADDDAKLPRVTDAESPSYAKGLHPNKTQASQTSYQINSGLPPPASTPKHTQPRLNDFKPDRLDPDEFKQIKYKTQKWFIVGRVFRMFFIENAGETADRQSLRGSNFTMVAKGEYAHHQFRRFVVVKEVPNQYFSYCCPISTYGGQGTTKKGVDEKAHTIVYSGDKPPELLPGEEGMNKDPLKIKLENQAHKLDPISRINLGRVHSIDHNFRVQSIGMVDERSIPKLLAYRQAVVDAQHRS